MIFQSNTTNGPPSIDVSTKSVKMTVSIPPPDHLMNTDSVDMECPACGRTISSIAKKCPFCCSDFEFHDLDDLEKVANGHPLDEEAKACTPAPVVEATPEEPVQTAPEASAPEAPKEEKVGRLGKLFGRGRK